MARCTAAIAFRPEWRQRRPDLADVWIEASTDDVNVADCDSMSAFLMGRSVDTLVWLGPSQEPLSVAGLQCFTAALLAVQRVKLSCLVLVCHEMLRPAVEKFRAECSASTTVRALFVTHPLGLSRKCAPEHGGGYVACCERVMESVSAALRTDDFPIDVTAIGHQLGTPESTPDGAAAVPSLAWLPERTCGACAGRRALITGVTGQDGAYLSAFLLYLGYTVYGTTRRTSTSNTDRITHVLPHRRFHLLPADLTDSGSLEAAVEAARPDEVYNLAAQSHVGESFSMPLYTAEVDGLGVMKLLEAVRKRAPAARVYQASTSELYGKVRAAPQGIDTPFHPRSPYGVAKLFGYWAVVNAREAYGVYAVNGVLFNHESPLRGEQFVTRKITRYVGEFHLARTKPGADLLPPLRLGNLDARRDWGDARDYVRGMWLLLQQAEPRDAVLATGATRTVRDFVRAAFAAVDVAVHFVGRGLEEVGKTADGRVVVVVDPSFFRPSEVSLLVGDAAYAESIGWTRRVSFEHMVQDMIHADIKAGASGRTYEVDAFRDLLLEEDYYESEDNDGNEDVSFGDDRDVLGPE